MATRRVPARFNGNAEPTPGANTGSVNTPLPNVPAANQKPKNKSTGPNFDFVHPEYSRRLPEWTKTRAAVEGGSSLSRSPANFLPDPTPLDESDEARARYKSYCERAVYFNATGRTKQGLIGIAFGDWPEITWPEAMSYLAEDADGAGLGIYGQCQHVLGDILETAWAGLLVDYPKVAPGDGVSIQARDNGVVPRIIFYKAEDIRDWATEKVGNQVRVTYVKLYEERDQRTPDGWALETVQMYRILRLIGGQYIQQLWVKGQGGWVQEGTDTIPLDSNGKPWDLIPFQFIGAEDNSISPSKPPLYDLADMNLAHYRNSADYEESVFMLGQPQMTMTGIDESWRDHIIEEGVYFGSRRVLMGPVGSTIGILQVQPNTLAAEAMVMKKEDMVALGARLLQPSSSNKTEHQSKAETRAAYSVLSLLCDNVSVAYKNALLWAQRFMGVSGEVDFAIDTDFDGLLFNTAIVDSLIKAVQAGIVPESEAWRVLRQLGIIDPEKSDEEIKEETEEAAEKAIQMQNALNPKPAPGGAKPPASE